MAIYFDGMVLNSLIVLYVIIALVMKFKFKKRYTYLLFFTVMYIYICNVINLTQFPIYIDDDQRKTFGGQNVWRDMSLIPLKQGFSMTSFYNILMTVPLGFGLPFIIKVSLKKVIYIGLFAGILFEMGQLLTALYAGYTFRFVDIDDVIFNFLGTLVGYLILFKLFKVVVEFFITKLRLKSNPIINYIRNT